MRNITEDIQSLINGDVNWSPSAFYAVIDILNEMGIGVSFWDGEENWASISNLDNKVSGYVWLKYPLVVYERSIRPAIPDALDDVLPDGVFCLEVETLNEDLFTIDDESLHQYFDGFFDFSSFTMEDVWFHTNSI